jgi:hypothetical protein
MGLSLISFILPSKTYDAMSLQQGSDFKLFFHHDVTFDYFFRAHIESPWDASVLFLIRQQITIISVVIFGQDYILLFLVTIHKCFAPSPRRPSGEYKRMVLELTHGLFIT